MKKRFRCTLVLVGLLAIGSGCGDSSPAGPDSNANPHAMSHAWSHRFGDAQAQTVTGMAIDPNGAIILAGLYSGKLDIGGGNLPGTAGAFIAKFAADGTHVWSHGYASAGVLGPELATDRTGNILAVGGLKGAVDFGGGVLTSAGGTDVYLVKFDPDGGHIWSKRFGDSSDQIAHAITVNSAGELCISGRFLGSVGFGGTTLASAGLGDLFAAKFGANGSHIWSKRFGDVSDQLSMRVEFDPSGELFAGGEYAGVLTFGMWTLTAQGPRDMFVTKTTSAGDGLWGLGFSTTTGGGMYLGDIAVATTGDVVLTGEFEGVQFGGTQLTGGAFGAKVGPSGDVLWALAFGGDVTQTARSVAIDALGNALFTGGFTGSIDFGGGQRAGNCQSNPCDLYIAKFARNGGSLWNTQFTASTEVEGRKIVADAGGNLYTAGSFKGELDFGGGPLVSAGDWDIYVTKLNAPE